MPKLTVDHVIAHLAKNPTAYIEVGRYKPYAYPTVRALVARGYTVKCLCRNVYEAHAKADAPKPVHKQRFKHPQMQKLYVTCLDAAADKASELYLPDGAQHTGALHRSAFWQGYNFGHLHERPSYIGINTLAYACYRAGRDWRQQVDPVTWKG